MAEGWRHPPGVSSAWWVRANTDVEALAQEVLHNLASHVPGPAAVADLASQSQSLESDGFIASAATSALAMGDLHRVAVLTANHDLADWHASMQIDAPPEALPEPRDFLTYTHDHVLRKRNLVACWEQIDTALRALADRHYATRTDLRIWEEQSHFKMPRNVLFTEDLLKRGLLPRGAVAKEAWRRFGPADRADATDPLSAEIPGGPYTAWSWSSALNDDLAPTAHWEDMLKFVLDTGSESQIAYFSLDFEFYIMGMEGRLPFANRRHYIDRAATSTVGYTPLDRRVGLELFLPMHQADDEFERLWKHVNRAIGVKLQRKRLRHHRLNRAHTGYTSQKL